ncbi:MAG: hypothetical protein ACNS60_18740 [Candidatus Cyclobacteriaceae bacterium M2_1C_046]
MKKLQPILPVLLILFSLISINGFSQNYIEPGQTNIGTGPIAVFSLSEPVGKSIDGHPYILKDWIPGTITFSDGKTVDVEFMNFNIHIDKISYKKGDKEYNTADQLDIERFTVGDKAFIYSLSEKGKKPEAFELLTDGDVKLLKKHYTDISKGKASNGYNDATNDRFILLETYYYKKGDLPAVEFKNKDKEVLVILSDEKETVDDYMDDNKLNSRKEEDLKKVFEYYNSIRK